MSEIPKKRRRFRYWPQILLLVATLALIEGAARLYVYVLAPRPLFQKYALYEEIPLEQRRVTPHPYLCYVNTPGFTRGKLSHNSNGFRAPEFPIAKPPGTFRVVAIGGSTTYTEAVEDNNEIYTAHLERILKEKGFSKLQVINAGVPGYNSWETFGNLCFRVIELQPDLVIFYEATNEVHSRFVRPDTYRADNRGRRKVWEIPKVGPLERYSTLYRVMKRLRKGTHIGLEPFVDAPTYIGPYTKFEDGDAGFHRILDEHQPVHFRNNLRNMIAVCQEHDAEFMLTSWAWSDAFEGDYASFEYYHRGFNEMNEVARRLAEEKGLPFYDFQKEMSQDRQYWHDGRHVNVEGSRLKGKLFARFLEQSGLLEDAR